MKKITQYKGFLGELKKGKADGAKNKGKGTEIEGYRKLLPTTKQGLLTLYKHAGIYCMLWFNFILGSIFILLCFFVW